MEFQTSTVTIVSDNPKYPNNKVTITVDNDLNPAHTIVVPDTSFPYIVQFTNCAEAVGKRYISDWLFQRLLLAHSSNSGKVSNTLQKEFSPYPYVTLDYQVFTDAINLQKSLFLTRRGNNITLLDDVGASINSIDTINPLNLLSWLNLPLVTGDGDPVKSFPILLGFQNKTDISVSTVLVERKIRDFFATTYYTDISYPLENYTETDPKESYTNFVESKGTTLFNGEYSKENKFKKILKNNKLKKLDDILSNAQNAKKSILGVVGLVAAASALKKKLDSLKSIDKAVKTLPKPPIKFNKTLVTAKIKKAEQKPKKKKRLSGKKANLPTEAPEVKNPAVEALKLKAGGLAGAAASAKSAARAQQQSITAKISSSVSNVVSYVVTTRVEGDTIFVDVLNNFGKPPITITYSAVNFTPDLAKSAIQFELDNFGIVGKDYDFYPKTGTPKPS